LRKSWELFQAHVFKDKALCLVGVGTASSQRKRECSCPSELAGSKLHSEKVLGSLESDSKNNEKMKPEFKNNGNGVGVSNARALGHRSKIMAGKVKATLTFGIYQGETLQRTERVTQDIIKVGKDPKSHLRIEDELASRMHAVIEVASPEDITLIDLGNEPGTKVNGANVNKTKILPGDVIEIGGTTIKLDSAEVAEELEEAAAAPPPPPKPSANPFAAPAKPAAPTANPFAASAPSANPFASGAASPFGAASGSAFGFTAVNPFAPSQPVDPTAVPDDAPEGSYTYALVKSGPDVDPKDVEASGTPAVEVMVLWETTVLHVQHLSPPRSYYVGEEEGKNFSCDFFVPSEKLGTTRAPILLASGGTVSAVLLPGAKGSVELPNVPKMTLEEVIASGQAKPCAELSGAYQLALPTNGRVRMEIEGLVFQVSAVDAGKRFPPLLFAAASLGVFMFIGLSFVAHVGVLGAMAFGFGGNLNDTNDEDSRKEQQILMQQFLKAAAEREEEEKKPEETQENADNTEGGTGTRAKGDEGSMGNPNTKAQGKKFGVKGPQDNPDPHIARAAAKKDAAEFGIIGLLSAGVGGDPDSPTAPWGRDDSLGSDALSAKGNMWGGEIGESFGAGGLGLSGIGEGGGGRGEGIGLGNIGTIGHGSGTGTGSGFGRGHGRLGGTHKAKAPKVRMGATSVSGRLPPEVIQRIVRQNYGRLRLCYEAGLRSNPSLQGRV
jgi:hypothetical protein